MMIFRAVMKLRSRQAVHPRTANTKGKLPSDKGRLLARNSRRRNIGISTPSRGAGSSAAPLPSRAAGIGRWPELYAGHEQHRHEDDRSKQSCAGGTLTCKDRPAWSRKFVCINVRGKDKFRELIAPQSVASYIERIHAISKATKPYVFVFTTQTGKPADSLYNSVITDLL